MAVGCAFTVDNILFLDAKRVELAAAEIQRNLTDLRRLRAVQANGGAPTTRNPALDNLLAIMLDMRGQLEHRIGQAALNSGVMRREVQVLESARSVLRDTEEILDLLKWLGAQPPAGAICGNVKSDSDGG